MFARLADGIRWGSSTAHTGLIRTRPTIDVMSTVIDASEEGIDQTSEEWRMAYAIWTEYFDERDRAAAHRQVRARQRHHLARRQGWWRYLLLFATLSATAAVTTVVMFWSLLYVLG